MKKSFSKLALIASLLVLAFSGSALAVGTVKPYSTETEKPKTEKPQSTQTKTKPPVVVKTRLEGEKLKSCENRETAINNILDKIAQRGEKKLGAYTSIFEKVQAFYIRKGLSVSNYEALVAEANTKKAAAQAAVDDIKAKQIEFACDGGDPKGAATGFKADLKAEISALHAYQQSIKNLVTAIRSSLEGVQ